jgi:hypothetical protein
MPSTPANALNLSSSGVVKFDGTATFSATPVTQYDVLVGGSSNQITSIGPGTGGQALLAGTGGADPSYVTPTAGTGASVTTNATTFLYSAVNAENILIQKQTASNSASIVFNTGVSGFNNYLLLMNNVNPTGASVTLNIQLSSNLGSTYFNTNYESGSNSANNSATFSNVGTSTSSWLFSSQSNGAISDFVVSIADLTTGNYPTMTMQGVSCDGSGVVLYYVASGAYIVNTAMNAFKIYFSAGNISTGTFSLYGLQF